MERDIVHKLTEEFAQPITSERQVVYILVELRKLLEKNDTLKQYRALKFCCDWAVHPKLDLPPAQIITELFDRYEAKYRREAVGASQADIPELVEFCEHTRFHAQLIDACASNGIPTECDERYRMVAFISKTFFRSRSRLPPRGAGSQDNVRDASDGLGSRF